MKLPRIASLASTPSVRGSARGRITPQAGGGCGAYNCELFATAQAAGMDVNDNCACVVDTSNQTSSCVSRQLVDQIQDLRRQFVAAFQRNDVAAMQELAPQLLPYQNFQESHMVCARVRPQPIQVPQTIQV